MLSESGRHGWRMAMGFAKPRTRKRQFCHRESTFFRQKKLVDEHQLCLFAESLKRSRWYLRFTLTARQTELLTMLLMKFLQRTILDDERLIVLDLPAE